MCCFISLVLPSPSSSLSLFSLCLSEFTPPVPFSSRFLNTRTMKETFKSFVELLISIALDADVMSALERENGGYTPNRGERGMVGTLPALGNIPRTRAPTHHVYLYRHKHCS